MADMGQLASGIAHDLNNPITVILGTVKLLLEDEVLSKNIRTDLDRISRSATLCQTITSNVLDFARNSEFKLLRCDIHDVLESALAIYSTTLDDCHVEIERCYGKNIPSVDVSAPHLQRVFLNLMSNARAVMKNGGNLRLRTEALPGLGGMERGLVQISVEDSGPGIAPEMMSKMFKPFNTTKGPKEGTGLGLYLSREIAIKHHGGLRAENVPGGGARFVLYLPAAEVAGREKAAA
jgi:signal transduction histidine kinase